MANTQIVVLGGGYSGLIAARRLGHKTHGKVEITLVNGTDHFLERIRLHQLAADEKLAPHPMRDLLDGTGVGFVRGWATSIDADRHSVTVKTDGGTRSLSYDTLIYALGSFPDSSRVPGVVEHTLPVGAETTALQLRARLPDVAERAGRLVIVGGGLTGIESATEIAEAYPNLNITLVTLDRFGSDLSEHGRARVRRVFSQLGIQILDATRVRVVEANRLLTDGDTLPFDLCLWAGPFGVPALAREAGLAVNGIGQAVVDPHLRSLSHPDIYVVGDAADLSQAVEAPIRMACATALPMGAYVADDLAARLKGKTHRAYDFAYAIRCISLGRRNGLIQFVDADDRPKERILSGHLAAWVKEMVCRYAFWQVRNDRWVYFFRHPKTGLAQVSGAVGSQREPV